LGVAAVAKSVPVTQTTEDATKMPKLHFGFLVEDVEYQPSQVQKLHQQIVRSGKKFVENSRLLREEDNEIEDGYGRRRRSSPSEDPFRSQVAEGGRRRRSPQFQNNQVLPLTNVESQDDQIAVESASRVSALNIANILKVAGAKPTAIVRQGGYGRKRRSPQDSSSNPQSLVTATSSVVSTRESRNLGAAIDIANILKIAGAEATPIDRQEGYGRKRRSPMDSSSNDFDSFRISEKLQSLSPSGGSDNRRKRSPQIEPAHSNAHQYGLVDNIDTSSVSVKPHGKYGDLQKILALSGAKPQAISRGVSYGRKKRSPQDLSNEIITNEIQTGQGLVKKVAIEAVKIKSHGNYGNIAQLYDAGANSKNVVFNGRFGRGKREDNFIPFNVYDEERVKTLKIEQNDFLALQSRLQIEKDSSDRSVKKRHFTANQ